MPSRHFPTHRLAGNNLHSVAFLPYMAPISAAKRALMASRLSRCHWREQAILRRQRVRRVTNKIANVCGNAAARDLLFRARVAQKHRVTLPATSRQIPFSVAALARTCARQGAIHNAISIVRVAMFWPEFRMMRFLMRPMYTGQLHRYVAFALIAGFARCEAQPRAPLWLFLLQGLFLSPTIDSDPRT